MPPVTVCISDPKGKGAFMCVDHNGAPFELPYQDSENYIAFPPDDFEALVRRCKLKQKE